MLLYNFINTTDLHASIREEVAGIITGNDDRNIYTSESAAISFVKSYLKNRYDIDDCFPIIHEWKPTNYYLVSNEVSLPTINHLGESTTIVYTPAYKRVGNIVVNYCYHKGKYYKALQDNINNLPTNNIYWVELDPRNAQLVQMAVDITLFYLHKRINPRKIPDIRTEMYNQHKEFLDMVNKSDITPDFPEYVNVQSDIDTILWGSSPSNQHYY